ncbi:hypothetical protein GUITHDRAFT_106737 [Guillardia theta CCMP2712]|uniref:Uncharacterized protein n=2 Tax=Guillardia theta TaxID=55529 RepID=L1JG62_GUITC|nr:hypothetical protein GUITHDRAFT_106737 [Guillardia theta CCMP2712]EKX47287.1 hypothetical protein GUITHDRAFT_106737 [Guillardia theta CCMP2712]|eukprot:XP_005834267.1 hypothetical protein GUITHDRAFT_106737 [Guillardia theta CCMP2712]
MDVRRLMDKARKEQLLQQGVAQKLRSKAFVSSKSAGKVHLSKPKQSSTMNKLHSILKIQKSQRLAETELHDIEKHFG